MNSRLRQLETSHEGSGHVTWRAGALDLIGKCGRGEGMVMEFPLVTGAAEGPLSHIFHCQTLQLSRSVAKSRRPSQLSLDKKRIYRINTLLYCMRI